MGKNVIKPSNRLSDGRNAENVANRQRIPDVVYHYTSMDTLLKIVESKSIWATNIRYLNDVMERRHCLDQIRGYMSTQHGPDRGELLSRLDEEVENETAFYFLPFVASFSAERDSLPQWRSYCPRGNGVSIGFRTESLLKGFVETPKAVEPFDDRPKQKHPYTPPTVNFGPVRYLKTDDPGEIGGLFAQAMREAEEMQIDEADWPEDWDDNDYLYHVIDKYASRTKHFSFASESEYRLLATTTWGNDISIKYRSSSSTLIPYIPIKLPNPSFMLTDLQGMLASSKMTPYFISSVTVGPTPHRELSGDALKGFFYAKQLGVQIVESIVPFRDL